MTITESVAVLPPEARKQEVPYHVILWLLGAQPHKNYQGGDGCALELDGKFYPLSGPDYEIVEALGCKLAAELPHRIVTPNDWMQAHRLASKYLAKYDAETGQEPDKKIVMLKDKGGAGYWRMVLPARYLGRELEPVVNPSDSEPGQTRTNSVRIDVTGASVKFDYLLEYDVVYVQRLHDWESYYVLEKLKKAGRRIVYDMDDDIFSLTPDNPAFHVISRDNQQAAVACMKMADVVTTTTNVLQNRLAQVLDGIWPEVIPNALDVDDGWLPTPSTGSPDEIRRIFWQGSATHAEDWQVCIEAVDHIMKEYRNVHLVILGFLPPVVIERLNNPCWKGRVEHLGFNDAETYFQIVKHVRADVGIAPLAPKPFNEAKCLVGDTMVVTEHMGCVPISEVERGDRIWQEDGFKEILATIRYKDRETVRLTTKMGYQIEGTFDHKIRVGVKFRDMARVAIGDRVDMSTFQFPARPLQHIPMPFLRTRSLESADWMTMDESLLPKVEVNEEWARFFGYVIGDGHLEKGNCIAISCDGQDEDIVGWLCDFARRIGLNPDTKPKKSGNGKGVDVKIPSRNLRWMLGKVCGFHGKRGEKAFRVPSVIFSSPQYVVAGFIRGLFEADGTVFATGCSFTSKSRELASGVQFLLLGFGVHSRIKEEWNEKYQKWYYTLILNRQSVDIFHRSIGFCSSRKKAELEEVTSKPHSNAYQEWDGTDEVVDISYGQADVYDVQVPDGEYYMASGFVSHNSPIKWLEYTCIGMPTVASAMEPYGSVIENGENGYLVPPDPDLWYGAVKACLDDPKAAKRVIEAARQEARDCYDIKQVAQCWREVLLPS